MIWLCVFLLLSPAAFGQSRTHRKPASSKARVAPPAQNKWPIGSLKVEGNQNYTSDQVLAVAGLKVGEVAGKAEFEAAYNRLVSSGAFETVDYRFGPGPESKSYAAVFTVHEVQQVYPWRFEGLGVPDKALKAWLESRDPLFSSKIPATERVVKRYTAWIQEYLVAQKIDEKVIGRVAADTKGELYIQFRPDRPIPTVAQVSFTGDKVIAQTALQNAISDVAVGTPYNEEHFRQLLDTSVRPLYDALGRVRVAFPKVVAEPARDVKGLAVKVAVEEGAPYDLGDIAVQGPTAMRPAELLKIGKFKTGELARFDEFNAGVERMKQALRKLGYMRVDATQERKIDDSRHVVNVVVRITEGPQFLFGKLTIQGLDLNGEAAIRKLWAMKEGKPYNAGYPAYFLDQVHQGGYFDNLHKTRAAPKIDEQNHTVDVTLYFQ